MLQFVNRNPNFGDIYTKPWNRVGPYAVGFLTGYILYKTDCKIKIPKVSQNLSPLCLKKASFVIWFHIAGNMTLTNQYIYTKAFLK